MCQAQIISVAGIIPAGATAPAFLRVTGTLSQCPSGQIVVSSTITAASSPISATAGSTGDGFVVVLPINAANVACGDTVTVRAECYQQPGCFDTFSGALPCCGVTVTGFDATVVPGSLVPSQINVSGLSAGCATSPYLVPDPVVVRVTFAGGVTAVTGPIVTDVISGSFLAHISVPAGATVQCDDLITVDAWCSSNTACTSPPLKRRLDCPPCARAQLSIVATSACTGTPAKQPITLGATIEIAKGTTRYFRWDYGDGSISPVFVIDNSTGTATTAHVVPAAAAPYYAVPTPTSPAVPLSHSYAPGTYTAHLVVTNALGVALECDKVPITVTASCDLCPTFSVSGGKAGSCVGGKRHVVLHTSISAFPPGTVLEWSFGDGTVGMAAAVTSTGAWPNPANVGVNEHDYAPGTYTATLSDILPAGCPPQTVTFTVSACPTVCCPQLTLDPPTVSGCAPGSVTASFDAHLVWAAGCTPVAATSFDWTLHTGSGAKYQKSTSLPSTDTSAGWHDAGNNPVIVAFATGGACSISVTAVIPGVTAPCNPTDTQAFSVAPCCPQLVGPLVASVTPGDPCTWLFSASVSNPNGAMTSFAWTFQDGAVATTSQPQVSHTYAAGAPTTGMTTVTLTSPGCPDQTLSVTITQLCTCPTIPMPSATVSGCLPGSPSVALSTSVSPPVATSFAWSVTTPGGVVFTKTTAAPGTSDGTADGAWTNGTTGAAGPLTINATGGYAVTVTASGAGLSPTCAQPPAMSFTIPSCGSSTLSCSIWCALAGLFLIAVPISAYISTVAHCLLGAPWNIVLQGAIIATAIGVFIAVCGECCVWLWLLIGAALGVIATIIAAYWLGFPSCWLQALFLVIGFVLLGLGMMIDCARRAAASSSSSTASSSSPLSSSSTRGSNRNLAWNSNQALTAVAPDQSPLAGQTLALTTFATASAAETGHTLAMHTEERAQTLPSASPEDPAASSGPETMAGLGDLVRRVTEVVGVRACAPCQRRAELLNRAVPFQ